MLRFKKRKLRVDILTIFLSLFLCSILTIVFYTHVRSNAAILKVGNNLIERNNQSIIEHLDNFLRPTPFIKMTGYLINDGILDFSDMNSLASFMHIILQSYPQLTSVYVADTKGNIFIENRLPASIANRALIPFIKNKIIPDNTVYLSEIITHPNNETALTIQYKDSEGKLLKTDQDPAINYDPRTRPWYLGAESTLDHPWVGVYPFFGTQKNGITVAYAIRANNQVKGVAAADLNIDLISDQLKKFSTHEDSTVFIVNNHGKIIAQKRERLTSYELPTIDQLQNPLITTVYNIHKQTGKNNFSFRFNGINYIATFTPYSFSPDEKWEIASVTPLEGFIEDIKDANQRVLIFSFIMLLLGLLLIIYASHRISYPIVRVAHATKDITKLKFDKDIKIKTHIHEVQLLVDALNTTKLALSSFAKYVPKTVVEHLLQTQTIAEVGGKKQPLTILFTDIENFTEITEKMDPELLMIQISEYLTVLTQCIQQHYGNIDKFIGDAVMAFWGAPIEDLDHTIHACQAVLACQFEMEKLNKTWKNLNKPTWITRYGLNSGTAIIGNMGSADRLNYTAIGDAVNLAARLETLNKIYKSNIIVSESIYAQCADKFLFRLLDTVQIRGKREIVTIYELIAAQPNSSEFSATPEQILLCDLSLKAYHTYLEGHFDKALSLFQEILDKFPDDGMAKLYIKRCQEKL